MRDVTWHAQAGQDEWVHRLHPTPGYFVDVGAHDGITHSNTYALERLGWNGLCLEPNADAFVQCADNRPGSRCGFGAASDHQGIAQFDGVRLTPDGQTPVFCSRLNDILDRSEAPAVIGYLSIDVEGHELDVLAGMDFARWRVELITIEHNLYSDGPARKNAIHEHLTGHGFVRVVEDVVAPGYGPYEDWYARA